MDWQYAPVNFTFLLYDKQRKQNQKLTDTLTAARDQLYKAKEKYRKSVRQKR